MSAGIYAVITGASAATATRGLARLVALGALSRSAQRPYARYALAVPVRGVAAVKLRPDSEVK